MPFFPKGRRGVLFCAPIWNITRKRRRGGPLRPPVPRCGTFPHSSRRGGACPSRHVSGMAMARRRGGSQTRPSSADHDTYRSRRLTGFRPAGRPPLPTAAKEAKRRRGWAPMGVPAHSRSTPGPPEFTGAQFWRPLGRCQAREGQRLPPHPRRCRCRSEIKTA